MTRDHPSVDPHDAPLVSKDHASLLVGVWLHEGKLVIPAGGGGLHMPGRSIVVRITSDSRVSRVE